ncbi:MAG: hypothetical protein GXZ18_05900 [Synergistaceae bacterium]|nr:hypothetical protein [Synergistaceae bacterium]
MGIETISLMLITLTVIIECLINTLIELILSHGLSATYFINLNLDRIIAAFIVLNLNSNFNRGKYTCACNSDGIGKRHENSLWHITLGQNVLLSF